MEGVEYIKYSVSPKLWVEEGYMVEVVEIKVVG